MPRGNRSFNFGVKHDALLVKLSGAKGITLTETIKRALEALEEKEAERDRLTGGVR